jgi:hypothetical protein
VAGPVFGAERIGNPQSVSAKRERFWEVLPTPFTFFIDKSGAKSENVGVGFRALQHDLDSESSADRHRSN